MKYSKNLSTISLIFVVTSFSISAHARTVSVSPGCSPECIKTLKGADQCTFNVRVKGNKVITQSTCTKEQLAAIRQTNPACGPCRITIE